MLPFFAAGIWPIHASFACLRRLLTAGQPTGHSV